MNQKIESYVKIPTELFIKNKNKTSITLADIFYCIGKKVYLGLSCTYQYFFITHKYYCSYNYHKSFWIEERRICTDTKINQSTLSIYIRILEKLGLLMVIRRGNKKDARSNRYMLVEPTQVNLRKSLEIAKTIDSEIKSAGSLRKYLISNNRRNKKRVEEMTDIILKDPQYKMNNSSLIKNRKDIIKDSKNRIHKVLG